MRQLSGLNARQNAEFSSLSEVISLFLLKFTCDLGLYTLKWKKKLEVLVRYQLMPNTVFQMNTIFDIFVTVHHWYNNINSQLDATIKGFIDNYNQINMFRATILLILRSTRLCLQLVV